MAFPRVHTMAPSDTVFSKTCAQHPTNGVLTGNTSVRYSVATV
jgi:hypothetical protein